MGKIVRQLGIKPQLLPGDGVDKAQRFGVQTLAVQAGDAVVGAVHRVPCHRVVSRLGGLSNAFAPFGRESHRLLLELEAVPFTPEGYVDLSRCLWPGPA